MTALISPLERLDALDRGVHQLQRARLPVPNQLRLRRGIQPREVLTHRPRLYPLPDRCAGGFIALRASGSRILAGSIAASLVRAYSIIGKPRRS